MLVLQVADHRLNRRTVSMPVENSPDVPE
jgi:hypothetical protein